MPVRVPVLAVRGGTGVPRAESVRLPRPPGALLFEHQPGRGFRMGTADQLGQLATEGGRQSLPGVCRGKPEKPARCAHPPGPCAPPRRDAHRGPRRNRGFRLSSSERAGRCRPLLFFRGHGRPAMRSSMGGQEPVTEGAERGGQGGRRGEGRAEDEDVHARAGRRGAVTGSGSTAAWWVSVRRWWAAR